MTLDTACTGWKRCNIKAIKVTQWSTIELMHVEGEGREEGERQTVCPHLKCYSNSSCGSLMDKNAIPAFRRVGLDMHLNSLIRQDRTVEEQILRLVGFDICERGPPQASQ